MPEAFFVSGRAEADEFRHFPIVHLSWLGSPGALDLAGSPGLAGALDLAGGLGPGHPQQRVKS